MKIEENKKAVLDDTILYIWHNAEDLNLKDVNNLINELIKVLEN